MTNTENISTDGKAKNVRRDLPWEVDENGRPIPHENDMHEACPHCQLGYKDLPDYRTMIVSRLFECGSEQSQTSLTAKTNGFYRLSACAVICALQEQVVDLQAEIVGLKGSGAS